MVARNSQRGQVERRISAQASATDRSTIVGVGERKDSVGSQRERQLVARRVPWISADPRVGKDDARNVAHETERSFELDLALGPIGAEPLGKLANRRRRPAASCDAHLADEALDDSNPDDAGAD